MTYPEGTRLIFQNVSGPCHGGFPLQPGPCDPYMGLSLYRLCTERIFSLSIYNRVLGPWAYWRIYNLVGVVYCKKCSRSLYIYNRVLGPWAYSRIYNLVGVVY